MKNIYLYIFTLAVSTACSSSDCAQEQNIALTQKMFEAFNNHDWQGDGIVLHGECIVS